MGSKEMTRKDFLTLTFTLIGGTVAGAACSSDNNNLDGGFGGTFGNSGTGKGGSGGTTGAGGGAGTTGTAGSGGTTGTATCSDPLPESQSASDHTHTVTIHPSMLDSTSAVTVDTSLVLSHMHTVTLEPAQLIVLKNGGTVMVTSGVALAHTHVYTISCT